MRLDKFLKVSRILKRRSVARDAAVEGNVDVNGKSAKPGHKLKVGDVVTVHFASGDLSFEVLVLAESVKKDQAAETYRIISEAQS